MISLLKNLKKKDWLIILISVALIVLQVFLELKMPDYTSELTKLVQSETTNMNDVWKNGGLMLLCALGSLISAIVCSFLISMVASSFSMTIREKLFNKITDFSNAEMKQFSVPSLITRTTNDVVQLQNFMAMGIMLLFKAPIMAIWAILKISSANIKWTIAVLIVVVIIVICIAILVSVCLPRFKKIQRLTDELNNVTRENVTGVRVVRAYNAEEYQENKFSKVNDEITSNNLFTSRTMGILLPILTLSMNGLILIIYWIGALLINDIALTGIEALNERVEVIGSMTAFSQIAMQVIMSFMMLVMIFIILPRTLVSAKRISEVLKTEPSINSGNLSSESNVEGEIEFRNVSFVYPDNHEKEKALNNISFKVTKGQTLAIIGATGSSKTTLVNLLPRFYDATEGEVLIDGINVKDYKQEELREKISYSSQKAALFKGTVKDNITYGAKEIDEEKIINSLELSQSLFILEHQDGINQEVAQGGTNFSGGQKQRISIARTLYKDSEIMIFDDTFSALDYKTDMLIRKAIKENYRDKTIIIVAQRIGTIKDADQIIVLEDGHIAGIGNHNELLENCAVYKEIALSQLSKEEL